MSELEQELLRRTYSLINRLGRPGLDYVGSPCLMVQVGHLKLEKRIGLSDTPWCSMVVYHCAMQGSPSTQAIYQEGNDHLSCSKELLLEAVLTLRQHMVLDDLAAL